MDKKIQGYSENMLVKLHETSNYSSERQLFTLLDELFQQKSIVATDFITRLTEIMTGIKYQISLNFKYNFFTLFIVRFSDLADPNSVTSKALHILPPLKFEL